MQCREEDYHQNAKLCLSRINLDNYSNTLNIMTPQEFKIIVIGSGMSSCSESFRLFLGEDGLMQLKEVYKNEELINSPL